MLGLVLAYAVQEIYCYITTGDSTLQYYFIHFHFKIFTHELLILRKLTLQLIMRDTKQESSKLIVIKGGTVKSFLVRFISYLAIRFKIA